MKHRYSLDGSNRLLVCGAGMTSPVCTQGDLAVDADNSFVYYLNMPEPWLSKYDLEKKIIFQGSWRLNKDHDLELVLQESDSQAKGDVLCLKGEIISAQANALVFQIRSRDAQGHDHIRLLRLGGSWQADAQNRIVFNVVKDAEPDLLTFEGAWQINGNQEIAYTYQKAGLERSDKNYHTLLFSGFWQITAKDRLSYFLSEGGGSRLDFRVQWESPNIHPKKGLIKYRLGTGLKQDKRGSRIISLFGVWKFSRTAGLIFQMQYSKGRFGSMQFGVEVNLKKNDRVSVQLRDEAGRDLGITLAFTRRFLKKLDAEFFLRLKKEQGEKGVDAGIRIPF